MVRYPQGGENEDKWGEALLLRALAKLRETTGFNVRRLNWEPTDDQDRADARLDFEPPLKPYWVEVKDGVIPARLGLILVDLKRLPRPTLLVAPYVTQPMALRLRQEGVQFLDAEGNAYLDQKTPRVLVWVTGNRPTKLQPHEKPLTVFRAAGLRVIFPFLCLPGATAATYRELAQMTGVALGTVAKTIEQLIHLGYLRKTKTHFALENKERLLNAWVDAYPRELRPLLEPRRFRTAQKEWWKDADWTRLGAWLGGEPAAALLTRHLHPTIATVYTARGITELANTLHLAKDAQGNIDILEKFWHFDIEVHQGGPRLAPPLLVYAELMATGDARNLETATLIRERYLG